MPLHRSTLLAFALFAAALLPAQAPPQPSLFFRAWDPVAGSGVPGSDVRTHKPSYLLLGRYSDHPNLEPQTPTRPPQALDLRPLESKFQVSFKVLLGTMEAHRLSLWGGYTQQSHWQVYNAAQSRPFRETNYEPELMVAWQPRREVFGMRWSLATLGLNHQSNGKSEPLSRSWNRVILQLGFERGPFALILRPWARVHETRSDDDNPDLERFLGHGEAVGILRLGRHTLTGIGRLNPGSGKGAFQAAWSFPIQAEGRGLRGYVQVFSGYGESLVDYNWRQNTVAIGFCLSEWL